MPVQERRHSPSMLGGPLAGSPDPLARMGGGRDDRSIAIGRHARPGYLRQDEMDMGCSRGNERRDTRFDVNRLPRNKWP